MSKPTVLHLGDPIRWNHELYEKLNSVCNVIRIPSEELERAVFKKALKDKKYGDFTAIYRPFWNTGGEMGNWDEELISLLPSSCKISASAGAGFDWVDTQRLAARGILYCNAAAACTEAVADAAIWLILSTFRLFSWSAIAARSASSAQFSDAHKNIAADTHNPSGSSLGIIGLGKIGYLIAQKASSAFGMKILYNDVVKMNENIERSVHATYYKNLDDMLGVADCVLVATPFGGNKILNADNMGKMKKGSRIVNIARGKLIDEEALVGALQSGQLFAAGLDVHYDEPNVNPKLAKMKNVELLSHTAGAAVESHMGFERLGMENILSYLETGKAVTAVNAHLLARSKL